MKKIYLKTIVVLAFLLTVSSSALAQTSWVGGQTYTLTSDITNYVSLSGYDVVHLIVPAGYVVTVSGAIDGQGDISKEGAGELVFTNDNYGWNWSFGKTEVKEGIWRIGNNGASGGIPNMMMTIKAGANLTFYRSDDYSYSGTLMGGGSFTKKGAGVLSYFAYISCGTVNIDEGAFYIAGGIDNFTNIVNNSVLAFFANNYTYSGVISGYGYLASAGEGSLTLNGVNTYTGETQIADNNKLILGANGSIENSARVIIYGYNPKFDISAGNKKIKGLHSENPNSEVILGASTLTIGTTGEADGGGNFSGIISGAGGITKRGTGYFGVEGNNTYTGTTTIEEGSLRIFSYGGTSPIGNIVGNIIVNEGAWLSFNHANDYTYSGIISGAGVVDKFNINTLTFSGANTHTGPTQIFGGTLVLSTSGSVENSVRVAFGDNTGGKLDISAGNKRIKGLVGFTPDHEIILGSSTLTIGTSGQGDGGGTFAGVFSGMGGVSKTGTGLFSMSGNNTATGNFLLNGGTLELANRWAGSFNQAAATQLDVKGDVSIGNALNLLGGNIYMDITQTIPSKINVTGAVSALGKTNLYITSGNVTNQIIMQAASGISSADPYELNIPGFAASLNATGTMLLLTATITDFSPPVPGNGVYGTANNNTATLIWTAATDNETPIGSLRYFVYQSSKDSLATPADCEANGTLLNKGGSLNITDYIATGLSPNTTYYFNVVVADQANNKAAYITKELTTGKVGIAETQCIASLRVYPNPTTGELRIEMGDMRYETGDMRYEIYDVCGRRMEIPRFARNDVEWQPQADGVVINIAHLPAGIYFLKIQTEQGVVVRKIIKN